MNATIGVKDFVIRATATPAKATCERVSAIKESLRNTKNIPIAGAVTPTKTEATIALFINSYWKISGIKLPMRVVGIMHKHIYRKSI